MSARHRRSSSHKDTVLASGDHETPWAVDRQRRPYGLRVVLPRRTYVLPWAQFLYAEGAPDTVRAVFSMHDVLVTGCGLEALLADFAAQVVTVVQQPLRAETFLPTSGPRVVAVEVHRMEGNGPSCQTVTRTAWVSVLPHAGASRRQRSARPSHRRQGSRCAEALSMPQGPAERGGEATRTHARAGARHA